jgi:hypothetical protein
LDISFICLFRVIRSSSVFSGAFIPEEVDGVGDEGSGDTITVDVQTPLEANLNMPPEI